MTVKNRIFFLLTGVICVLPLFQAAAVRVVSMSPALTETIFALGGGPLLVGRSSSCNRPAAALDLPAAGDFATPNLEVVMTLNADLVVSDTLQDPAVKQSLNDLGIRVEVLPLNSLDDYEAALTVLGGLLNVEEKAAELKSKSQRARREFADEISGTASVGTLLLLWDDPPMSCGRRAFFNDFVALAGGVNVLGGVDAGYFYPSSEVIEAAAPEAVFFPANGGMTLESLKKHLAVPAARDGKLYAIEDVDLIFRLTPRWPEAVVILRGMLHPESVKIKMTDGSGADKTLEVPVNEDDKK